jgi:hypothetical protein
VTAHWPKLRSIDNRQHGPCHHRYSPRNQSDTPREGEQPYAVGDTFRVQGLELTDHFFKVPLSHFNPADADADAAHAETIEVFAREVVSISKADEAKRKDLPYLLFLQGGPGGAVQVECSLPMALNRMVSTLETLIAVSEFAFNCNLYRYFPGSRRRAPRRLAGGSARWDCTRVNAVDTIA